MSYVLCPHATENREVARDNIVLVTLPAINHLVLQAAFWDRAYGTKIVGLMF